MNKQKNNQPPEPESSTTDDEQIKRDFEERQQLAEASGDEKLEEDLKYTSVSPSLSGGDVDANWQDANVSGEEAVGGTTPTPDQDMVDELGEAVGLTYKGDEELGGEEKLAERDRERWELNPDSAFDDEQDPESTDDE
jgi:hypothetical protein